MRSENARDAHPRLRDLFEDDRVGDGVDSAAAVLVGHEDAEQPHLLHLLDDLGRIAPAQLPFASNRSDAATGEFADQVAKLGLLWGEFEVHLFSPGADAVRPAIGRAGRSAQRGGTRWRRHTPVRTSLMHL